MEIRSKFGPVKILYEDNQLIAAVKPPNLPSQSDLSGDEDILTLVREYIAQKYNKPGQAYLGLVHRLDRPVGGVMVFARTSKAAARLSEQFASHSAQKKYLAVLEGEMKAPRRMECWLVQRQGQNAAVAREGAPGAKKAALTSAPVCVRDSLTLTQVTLETGRKHQIRVQHAHEGLPLWGDSRYGHGRPGQQIALWAYCLRVEHPTKHETITFECLPPKSGVWAKFESELSALKNSASEEKGKQ